MTFFLASIISIALFIDGGTFAAAQQALAAQPITPPATKHPLVPSHGSNLFGVFYLAGGTQPHPTAILFHGLPGYEQNLDLAQALRRDGWNVLALHYRGSWGVGGGFSFLHCVEDADTEVRFLLSPDNVSKYHIDTQRIVVIGHSMGGFVAIASMAHNPEVKAAVLISAWNVGAPRPSEAEEAKALRSGDNLVPLSGTDGVALAHEEFAHRTELDMDHFADAIARRPLLIVTAEDNSDQFAQPLIRALQGAGGPLPRSVHLQSDHAYSGKRLELISAVEEFLKGLL